MKRMSYLVGGLLGLFLITALPLSGQTAVEQELKEMRKLLLELKKADEEKTAKIAELEERLKTSETKTERMVDFWDEDGAPAPGGTAHLHDHEGHDHMFEIPHANTGVDVSASFGLVFGGSTAYEEKLGDLASGEHDPNNDGIDFTGLELAISGDVDKYFSFFAAMVWLLEAESLETEVELEEAYATSKGWPYGLEAKVGYYYTEFGLANAVHAHARQWLDQPILRTRLFGADGMRSTGARLAWDVPVDWESRWIVGFQSARGGATVASFGGGELTHGHEHEGEDDHHSFYEAGIAGRPIEEFSQHNLDDFMLSTRLENTFEILEDVDMTIGGSGAFGRNFTGDDSVTIISGGDVAFVWKPAHPRSEGQQFSWKTELAVRHLFADDQSVTAPGPDEMEGTGDDVDVVLDSETYEDLALYTEALYSFNRQWHVGLRYEFANSLNGDSIEIDDETGDIELSTDEDVFRSERHRFSPLVIFQPSEFTRFRAQYNYDVTEFLESDAHSFWFGVQFDIGGGHHGHDH